MCAKLSLIGRALLLALFAVQPVGTSASAQDFSRLQCPILAELRMDMLVTYNYCPQERFYAKRFADKSRDCDPEITQDDAEEQILNLPESPEDRDRYNAILEALQRNNCDF